jgi:hypothetical protein
MLQIGEPLVDLGSYLEPVAQVDMRASFKQPETGGFGRRDGREDGSGSRATG